MADTRGAVRVNVCFYGVLMGTLTRDGYGGLARRNKLPFVVG